MRGITLNVPSTTAPTPLPITRSIARRPNRSGGQPNEFVTTRPAVRSVREPAAKTPTTPPRSWTTNVARSTPQRSRRVSTIGWKLGDLDVVAIATAEAGAREVERYAPEVGAEFGDCISPYEAPHAGVNKHQNRSGSLVGVVDVDQLALPGSMLMKLEREGPLLFAEPLGPGELIGLFGHRHGCSLEVVTVIEGRSGGLSCDTVRPMSHRERLDRPCSHG